MHNKYFDADEIRKTISILKPGGQLFEVRAVLGKKIWSGYFRDPEILIGQLSKLDLNGFNVYMTIQQIHEGCEARLQWNRFLKSGMDDIPTTSDDNGIRYAFIPIDLDPVRPKGISSTHEELEDANELRKQIIPYMDAQGFKQYIQAFSGNGYHLLYPVDFPANNETKEYVHNILIRLDELFSNSRCKVDLTNYTPGRVLKLYGTLAQKGRNTAARPHRMSKILEVKGFETS